MNISGIGGQNLTLTLSGSSVVRLEVLGQQPRSVPFASGSHFKPTPVPVDTVRLSSQAVSQQESARSTLAPARGDALFDALDGDGEVTREEFVDGARNLLRRAHHGRHGNHDRVDRSELGRQDDGRHGRVERSEDVRQDGRHEGVEQSGHGRHGHGHRGHGLTHRLERVFNYVDANEDGGIDKAELASALERARGSAPAEPTAAPEAPVSPTAPDIVVQAVPVNESEPTVSVVNDDAVTTEVPVENGPSASEVPVGLAGGSLVSITQITVVTVAIQTYTSLSFGDPAAQPHRISTTA